MGAERPQRNGMPGRPFVIAYHQVSLPEGQDRLARAAGLVLAGAVPVASPGACQRNTAMGDRVVTAEKGECVG